MIEFRDVAVCYSPLDRYPVNALEGITLQVADGEWVFLVGPSGAGKSTLLKLIYGDARAERGHVLVDNRDVTQLPPQQIPMLRRGIGVIFQDFQLLPQKTVWENVAFALQVIGAPQKRLVRDVPRALDTVGLGHKADSRPNQLSGGERQRVSIARAIVNNPRLLLADEPTGNLDPQTGQDIIDVLQRINASGTTVVMATHDRAVVDRMQRRVVRLADGRIFSDEAHGVYHPEDEVLHQPGAAVTSSPSPRPPIAPQSTLTPSSAAPTNVPAPQMSPHNNGANEKDEKTHQAPHQAARASNGRHDPYGDVMPPNDAGASGDVRETRPYAAPWLDEEAPSGEVPLRVTTNGRATTSRPRNANSPVEDERDSPFETPKRNDAPLGSPENPLVQFELPPSRPRRES